MIEVIEPDWDAPTGIGAVLTTRVGEGSQAPYAGLNLGLHVGDDAGQVLKNREQLKSFCQLPADPDWINQTHSTRVVTLEEDNERNADAAITRQPGRVAVVMVADCLPILICNRDATEVAAIHAGWRGLQTGVIQASVAAMQSSPDTLIAYIGPAISQASFEVGDEVRNAFIESASDSGDYFSAHGPGHWLCDLSGIATLVLRQLGVGEVVKSSYCSFRDEDKFYSYRRDGVTGRQAALIWIK